MRHIKVKPRGVDSRFSDEDDKTLNVSFTVPSYAILVHVDDGDALKQGLIDHPEEKNRGTIIFLRNAFGL